MDQAIDDMKKSHKLSIGWFRKLLCFDIRRCRLLKILKTILYVMLIIGIFWIVYIESYVWQVTVMRNFLKLTTRTKCHLPIIGNHLHVGKKYSIALLMIYKRDGSSEWVDDMMHRVMRNRKEYAKKYGYSVINANDLIDKSRPAAWSKLIAVKKYLQLYDYIFYIDMDAVIMDMNRPLTDFIHITINHPYHIQTQNKLNHLSNQSLYRKKSKDDNNDYNNQIDIIMTNDWNGPNTGIWLIRNSTWSINFLHLLWSQTQFLNEKSPNGIPYPFEYEQRAFHYLLNTDIWQKRKLPRYQEYINNKDNNSNKIPIRNHIYILPQCAFNSYSIHPFYYRSTDLSFGLDTQTQGNKHERGKGSILADAQVYNFILYNTYIYYIFIYTIIQLKTY